MSSRLHTSLFLLGAQALPRPPAGAVPHRNLSGEPTPASADLRQQVLTATTGDVISLATGTTYAWDDSVYLGRSGSGPGRKSSATSITLLGAGAGSSIIDGCGQSDQQPSCDGGKAYFFYLATHSSLTLKDLTLANGKDTVRRRRGLLACMASRGARSWPVADAPSPSGLCRLRIADRWGD